MPNNQSLQRVLHRQRRLAYAAVERPRTPPACYKQCNETHDWSREAATATPKSAA
jgi:hypothetical protein